MRSKTMTIDETNPNLKEITITRHILFLTLYLSINGALITHFSETILIDTISTLGWNTIIVYFQNQAHDDQIAAVFALLVIRTQLILILYLLSLRLMGFNYYLNPETELSISLYTFFTEKFRGIPYYQIVLSSFLFLFFNLMFSFERRVFIRYKDGDETFELYFYLGIILVIFSLVALYIRRSALDIIQIVNNFHKIMFLLVILAIFSLYSSEINIFVHIGYIITVMILSTQCIYMINQSELKFKEPELYPKLSY